MSVARKFPATYVQGRGRRANLDMSDLGGTVVLQLTIPWWGWCGIVAALIGIGVWIGRVNTDRESFKGFVQEIKSDIKDIRININRIFERLPATELVQNEKPGHAD